MLDLHTHSYFSDGTFSPEEIVSLASEKNITRLALTDHDNLVAFTRFQEACKQKQITCIPGVEITIDYEVGLFHLLALGIKPSHVRLQEVLKKALQLRAERMQNMLDYMKEEYNKPIEFTFAPQVAYGRFHMAILLRDQYGIQLSDTFDRYLISFKNEGHISLKEAIKLVHEAGGKAIIAHPKTLSNNRNTIQDIIEEAVAYGLDGLEVYSGRHSADDIAFFMKLVKKHQLLVTAGSDFHGDNKPNVILGNWQKQKAITSDLISPYWLTMK